MKPGPVVALWVASLLTTVLCGGCGERPRDGFEAFFVATQQKDADAAWDRLTVASRASLEEMAGRRRIDLRAEQGSVKTMSAKDFLFGDGGGAQAGLQMTATLKSVEVVEQDGARALVEVQDVLGQRSRVHMRQEDGRWKLDLVATSQGAR